MAEPRAPLSEDDIRAICGRDLCYNVSGPTGCSTTLPALTTTFLFERIDMADANLIKMRKAAKAAGATRFFYDKPCKHGHIGERYASTGACVTCNRAKSAAAWATKPEMLRQQAEQWREANREYLREKQRRYYAANRERCQAANKACAAKKPELQKEAERRRRERLLADPAAMEARREGPRQWHRRFPERTSAATRRRKLAKIQRTPAWLTVEQCAEMAAFYADAVRLTRETGVTHEVDHIVPLQGETVSGLHVPWNLQIMTGAENRAKGNKHGD